MSELLKELNKNGLIEKLDGDDGRFAKIEKAADSLAQKLKGNHQLLIRAILAGIDPDIPASDPTIAQAEDALYQEWPSVRSIHTDPPILLYRYILLDACSQIADDTCVIILWNTIADTFPLIRLGREEEILSKKITQWATLAEQSLISPCSVKTQPSEEIELKEIKPPKSKYDKINPDPQEIKNKLNVNTSSYQPNSSHVWMPVFVENLTTTIIDELKSLDDDFLNIQNSFIDGIYKHTNEITKTLSQSIKTIDAHVSNALIYVRDREKIEHNKLSILWWSEALYSSSLHFSYRNIDPIIAAVIMPFDLLLEAIAPTPSSVSHVLAETVSKLAKSSYDEKYDMTEILTRLNTHKKILPPNWNKSITPAPDEGRLSIRDLIVSILLNHNHNMESLIQRSGLYQDTQISLPRLAQAIFRQEQAVRLSQEKLENILEDAQ